jgi:hypothetical protein
MIKFLELASKSSYPGNDSRGVFSLEMDPERLGRLDQDPEGQAFRWNRKTRRVPPIGPWNEGEGLYLEEDPPPDQPFLPFLR